MAKAKSESTKKISAKDSLADDYTVTDIVESEFKGEDGKLKIRKIYYRGDEVVGEEVKDL